MKRLLIASAIALVQLTAAYAVEWTPENIAQLPQDKVQKIVKVCEKQEPDSYSLQKVCEDSEFDALSDLIIRKSFLEGVKQGQGH